MNVWSQYSTLLPGTDGRSIDMREWQKKTIKSALHQRDGVPRYLRRGQLGCYDSHVRAWQYLVEHNLPMMLVAEDDANLIYSPYTVQRLETCFREIEEYNIKFDILHLGHSFHRVSKRLTPHLYKAWKCQGAFLYILTLEGAKKLLTKCEPYRVPVDVYMHRAPNINILSLHPGLCGVVKVRSDTVNIR